MFGNVLDSRLDQRKHGSYRLIQVGEADGIDMCLIHGHFHLQGGVVKRDGGCVYSWHVFLLVGFGLFIFGKEHEYQQQDKYDCQCGEDCRVNNLLHMQYDDFCFGTH